MRVRFKTQRAPSWLVQSFPLQYGQLNGTSLPFPETIGMLIANIYRASRDAERRREGERRQQAIATFRANLKQGSP